MKLHINKISHHVLMNGPKKTTRMRVVFCVGYVVNDGSIAISQADADNREPLVVVELIFEILAFSLDATIAPVGLKAW